MFILLAMIINLRIFCFAFNYENYVSDVHQVLEINCDFDEMCCHCWNNNNNTKEIECRCHGNKLLKVPENLPEDMGTFSMSDAEIKVLEKDAFVRHRHSLKDITLSQLPYLEVIEPGAFRKIPNLRSIYIDDALLLKTLPQLFLGVNSNNFLILRIMHTGLEEIPDMTLLGDSSTLRMVDLEANNLKYLRANSIRMKVQQLVLNYNHISYVDAYAFNGSQIAMLKLKGNRPLLSMHELAFKGLNSLRELDVSGTSLESLPVEGLQDIEVLRIQDTPTLKKIPSIYDFKNLQKAWLTYSFHCCAFKFPIKHDPTRHAAYITKIKEVCKRVPKNLLSNYHVVRKRHINNIAKSFNSDLFNSTKNKFIDVLRGEAIATIEDNDFVQDIIEYDEEGTFHDSVDNPDDNIHVICGNISQRMREVQCYPQPDALNPCEDIMGSNWLRISVWFVVITAVLGNLAVIVVFFSNLFDINVSKFLMFNLAFADVCMGIYLLLIASMDLHSMGFYFNFAYPWQIGDGCKIAGFLTVFSSQLSVFTLTIITLERWFAIRYAIYLNKRIRLGAAYKIMIFGWCYSVLMASLPLVGVSNYSSTSICLPMEAKEGIDMTYLASLLLANGLAFLIIVICYTQIYFSLGTTTRRSITNNEMAIAKKMALLVFTDFACWAPIAFFGLTALAGYPLINVTKSKILLVFFYPLNSCANPYLYAILTAQYRRDFFALLYKCGVCKNVKKPMFSNNTMQTNQSNPVPLLSRSNNLSDKSNKSCKGVEEALV